MRLRQPIAAHVRRLVPEDSAEDLIQDVITRLYAALPSYDPTREFWPWFNEISRNLVVDAWRKADRDIEDLVDPMRMPEPDPEDSDFAEMITIVTAIGELPDKLGRAVVLHIYSGLTFEEMGRLTGVSPNTWSSRFRLARERLREKLGESW